MATANSVSNTELPSAALRVCHPTSSATPKQVSRTVARIANAGTTATGRYQFTDSVYLRKFSQLLPYLPQRPSRPATADKNAVPRATRNPVIAIHDRLFGFISS